jgi:hypothetical protein
VGVVSLEYQHAHIKEGDLGEGTLPYSCRGTGISILRLILVVLHIWSCAHLPLLVISASPHLVAVEVTCNCKRRLNLMEEGTCSCGWRSLTCAVHKKNQIELVLSLMC